MKTTLDDFEIDIKHYNPQAGDVLVLRSPRMLTHEQCQRIAEQCEQSIPGVRVIVLEDGMGFGVLRKTDDKPCPLCEPQVRVIRE